MSVLNMASCSCYLSKTHFVLDFLENSIGNSCNSTTCNPICSKGTILKLQTTMQFHRQLVHQTTTTCNPISIAGTILYFQIIVEFCRPQKTRNTGGTPFTMRNRSENDPSVIRPHTRPSRNRPTAEIDQRGSGGGGSLCGETPHRRPSRTRRTAEVDHGRLVWDVLCREKAHGFMQLLSLKKQISC